MHKNTDGRLHSIDGFSNNEQILLGLKNKESLHSSRFIPREGMCPLKRDSLVELSRVLQSVPRGLSQLDEMRNSRRQLTFMVVIYLDCCL